MPLKDAAAIDKNFLIPNHLLKEENKPLPIIFTQATAVLLAWLAILLKS